MLRLEDLTLFVLVCALGGFSSAAREADLPPGQVSAAIQRLSGNWTCACSCAPRAACG